MTMKQYLITRMCFWPRILFFQVSLELHATLTIVPHHLVRMAESVNSQTMASAVFVLQDLVGTFVRYFAENLLILIYLRLKYGIKVIR